MPSRKVVLGTVAAAAGLVISVGLFVYLTWDSGPKNRSQPSFQVRTIKGYAADLGKTFQQGKTFVVIAGDRPGRPDARVGLVMLLLDKVRSNIERRADDLEASRPALAKLAEANKAFREEFVPEFLAAQASRDPEQARALVRHMEALDKRMDEMVALLP